MRNIPELSGKFTPRIGYTYFGQFIDHDLTQDRTPFAGPYQQPKDTPNFRSGYLDLDNVYGDGPGGAASHLYTGAAGAATFVVGSTPSGHQRDFQFVAGQPLIADSGDLRDLDNVMVRQIHVLFMKFHNETIRRLSANPPQITFPEGSEPTGSLFERARKIVTWHYQWLVRYKFLGAVVKNDVWYKLLDGTLPITPQTDFAIPIEFATAAFRFGHSMVRDSYSLNCKKTDVEVTTLMGNPQQPVPLADYDAIEWGLFFDGLPASRGTTGSSSIDTAITAALHNVPPPSSPINLPVRALLRGARYKVASGQEVFDYYRVKNLVTDADRLSADELMRDVNNLSGTALRNANLQENTPLFYYILKEAELRENEGRKLGSLGGLIITEVIETALQSDPASYMNAFPDGWSRPLWNSQSGSPATVGSILDIVKLVGDDKLLFGCKPMGT